MITFHEVGYLIFLCMRGWHMNWCSAKGRALFCSARLDFSCRPQGGSLYGLYHFIVLFNHRDATPQAVFAFLVKRASFLEKSVVFLVKCVSNSSRLWLRLLFLFEKVTLKPLRARIHSKVHSKLFLELVPLTSHNRNFLSKIWYLSRGVWRWYWDSGSNN